MVSIGTMIDQLEGLLGTDDVNDWESQFIENMIDRKNKHLGITSNQAEKIESIWRKHFA